MKLIKLIRVAYIAYTIYILCLVDVTSLNIMDMLPSLLMLWLVYFFFYLGYITTSKRSLVVYKKSNFIRKTRTIIISNRYIFFMSCASVIASILSARYYTGKMPIDVFAGLTDGSRSLYYEYQSYFAVNNIAVFGLKKVPYILLTFYAKTMLFYVPISRFLLKRKREILDYICVGLVIVAHIYFSLARGTNFELFEIVILFIYIILSKEKKGNNIHKRSAVKFVSIALSIGVMMILFSNRISARGVVFDYFSNTEFEYAPQGVISIISRSFALPFILIYDYFGFGFYSISYYLSNIWMSSIDNFLAGLIPFGSELFLGTTIREIMGEALIIRSRWTPDILIAISTFGMLGLMILLFFMGRILKSTCNTGKTSLVYLTQLLIFMQMISFPIGNFVFVSSATTLIVLLVGFMWIWKRFVKIKIRL